MGTEPGMETQFTEKELGECLELVIDHRGKTPKKLGADWVDSGIPTISAKNVNGGRLVATDDIRHVSHDVYKRWMKKDVKRGDCLLVSEGATLGECMMWDYDYPIVLGQRIFCLRANPSVLYPRYLYAYMTSASFQSEIIGRATGTSVDGLRQTEVLKLKLRLPPLAQQRHIGDTLYNLDKKIEFNRRMNATLEAMARALFQSWFVDFDPIRTKLDGRPPAALDPATAALFPEHLEDSKLGHIPRGWEVKTIESLCDVITSGGTPARMHKAYWEPATVPWFKTGELMDGPLIDAEERISEDGLANSSCKLWPAGTILFALYASPTVGRFGVLTKPGTANQAAAALIAKPAYGVPFLMGLLYEARAELQRVAVGAAQQNINQGVLKSHVVIAPPPALAKAYSDKVAPWFDQRTKLAEQSRTLATLRDTLLPKLLSGEVTIRN